VVGTAALYVTVLSTTLYPPVELKANALSQKDVQEDILAITKPVQLVSDSF